jgi:hypothetical protein
MRGGRTKRVLAFALLLAAGCGYRALHSGESYERLHVSLARAHVANAAAADDVLAGVREALAREGALASGDGYPRVEVEVLRADEVSEAIAGGAAPAARSSSVGLVARAWIVRDAGGDRERDTGDVRALGAVAPGADARTDLLQHDDAARAVARRLGRKLAARLLGHPAISEDALGGAP